MARFDMPLAPEAGIGALASTAQMLFDLGMVHCIGRHVAQDYVAAHKWFNLAALRGSAEARCYRAEIAHEMTSRQIAQAQREARDWLARQ